MLPPGDAPGRRRLSRTAIIGGVSAGTVVIAVVAVVATLLATRGPAGGNGGPPNATDGHHPAAGHSQGTNVSVKHRQQGSAPGTPQPTLAPNLDRCLIGTWKGLNETDPGYVYGQPVQYVGQGATQTFWPNGRGKAYYGKHMAYRAKINGNVWTDVFSGYVTFDWTAKNDATRTYRVRSHGTSLLYENGVFQNSRPLRVLSGLGRYTCSGNSLQFYDHGAVTILTRELPK